ncbi:hypothetical protein [Helicobacter acinonychis]|uniref:Uncharacterized protein n=2 Tax=Helicobacter acinonychis TaxID=212 RepID=Q17X78_HELAH|nr:hypothetical protein [Helicobacter acinonychis]CAJ99748.1 conserved hypothetical protein [Helicobacter acinonychis str. Sheeba]STP04305.1 Uncharacterised protein [Helicobacter acinonychis]
MSDKDLEIQEKEKIKKKKGRKYIYIFLGTIIGLFITYNIISIILYNEPSQEMKTAHTKTILKYLPDLIKNNLDSHQLEISDLLNSGKDRMYSEIDTQVDNLFNPIENNVDKFLDWHYSLKGNYTELGLWLAKATGLSVKDAIANKLQEKFLGTDYEQRLKTMTDNISDTYISLLTQHKEDVEKIATQGMDTNDSQIAEILKNIDDGIDDKIKEHVKLKSYFIGAVGVVASVGVGVIMGKIAPEFLAKLSTRFGVGILTKGIGGGLISAIGVDVAFNYFDEKLNRKKFKEEIENNIKKVKEDLKENLKDDFDDSIEELGDDLKNAFTNPQAIVGGQTLKDRMKGLDPNTQEKDSKRTIEMFNKMLNQNIQENFEKIEIFGVPQTETFKDLNQNTPKENNQGDNQ